jgi:hypothetical protein
MGLPGIIGADLLLPHHLHVHRLTPESGVPNIVGDSIGFVEVKEAVIRDVFTVEKNILMSHGFNESVILFFAEPLDNAFVHVFFSELK